LPKNLPAIKIGESAGQSDPDGSQGRNTGKDHPDGANDLTAKRGSGQVPTDGDSGGCRQVERDGELNVQLVHQDKTRHRLLEGHEAGPVAVDARGRFGPTR
jgi:hypothetical protein